MKRERNSFLTLLVVEVMPSGKMFKLHHDFKYHYRQLNIVIKVAAGFETDFASIPRFARLLIPKLGRYNKAAVLHDALYQGAIAGGTTSRKRADLLFRDAMKDLGVAPWKRFLMYWAVRIGGFMAWRKR